MTATMGAFPSLARAKEDHWAKVAQNPIVVLGRILKDFLEGAGPAFDVNNSVGRDR